jgi:hypothetical protein
MSLADSPLIFDDWFSSPWNFLPEATGSMCLSESLKVHDVSRCEMENEQDGVEFTVDEKVRIAGLFDSAGVHRIETGISQFCIATHR